MGYTISFDASEKLGGKDIGWWLMHTARDVDMRNGREHRHSNPNIDRRKTLDNQTFIYDSEAGEYIPCENVENAHSALLRRLETVKKPLRKDTVVARPLIIQLDPLWYEDNEDDYEAIAQSYEDMLEWAEGQFGSENLVCVSVHEDEASPHMHLLFTPVTEDGRLSQKDWFPNPEALRKMHRDLREFMAEKGYDIEMDNRKPGKFAKRMKEREYRDFKELETAKSRLQFRIKANFDRQMELDRREEELNARETRLKAQEEDLEEKAKRINAGTSKTPPRG